MKKALKILFTTLLLCAISFSLAACGGSSAGTGGNDDNGGTSGGAHVCSFTEATEWYDADADKVFVKTYKCSGCEETKKVTALEISTADQLVKWAKYVNANKHYSFNVKLVNDIDMADVAFTPININIASKRNAYNIDGAGSGITIKNLTIASGTNVGFFGTLNGEINVGNITLQNAHMAGTNVGCFVGLIDTTKDVSFEKCAVKESSVVGSEYAGGFYAIAKSLTNDAVNVHFKKLSIQDTTVTGPNFVGGVAGFAANGKVLSADRKVERSIMVKMTDLDMNNVTSTSTGAEKNKVGAVVGVIGNGFMTVEFKDAVLDVNSTVIAIYNGASVVRNYGRTGWTSASTAGYYGFASAIYNPLANTTHFDKNINDAND